MYCEGTSGDADVKNTRLMEKLTFQIILLLTDGEHVLISYCDCGLMTCYEPTCGGHWFADDNRKRFFV